MASLYAQYLQERTEDCIWETKEGFATYRYINGGNTVYVIDIYVIPEARKNHHAAHMADRIAEIAKFKGCTEMIGTVVPGTKGSTDSLKVLLAYGMSLKSAGDNLIVMGRGL